MTHGIKIEKEIQSTVESFLHLKGKGLNMPSFEPWSLRQLSTQLGPGGHPAMNRTNQQKPNKQTTSKGERLPFWVEPLCRYSAVQRAFRI